MAAAYSAEGRAHASAVEELKKAGDFSIIREITSVEDSGFTAPGLFCSALARSYLGFSRVKATGALSSYANCRAASALARNECLRCERSMKSLARLCEKAAKRQIREIEKREEAEADDDQRNSGDF